MSTLPLTNKIALITGSSKGIGAATARYLASQGAKVVINYASNAAAAEALVQEIGPDNAIAVQADVGSVPALEYLVRVTVERWGRIDLLVANAGVLVMRDLEGTEEAEWERVFRVNVKGVYFLCQKAVPYMPPGSHITLLSTSLTTASTITPSYLLYVSSKGAIEQMTRVLAKDLGRKGIRVNCVAPGPTATDMFLEGKSQELVREIAGGNPFGRLGMPEEIAGVIGFLCGEGSLWVSGQVLRANGGMA